MCNNSNYQNILIIIYEEIKRLLLTVTPEVMEINCSSEDSSDSECYGENYGYLLYDLTQKKVNNILIETPFINYHEYCFTKLCYNSVLKETDIFGEIL